MDSWSWPHRLLRELRAGTWQKLLRLPSRQRWMLLSASLRLLVVALALRVWSLPTIVRWLHRRAVANCSSSADGTEQARLADLVELADRHGVLPPSCLRRSLVLAWFFSDQGVVPSLRIGVAREANQLRAHAWVELSGQQTEAFFAEPEFTVLS